MSRKVLFVATVDDHFKAFHIPYLKWFQEEGWEVHVAASGKLELPYVNCKYDLPIQRSPFKIQNVQAYKELKAIIETNKYEIIHCHTPVGGVLARLAARAARKEGTKLLYTAHGFHFCKGASLQNWMIYYPIETWLSHFTDCLITISEEDYGLAVKHNFQANVIERIHGVGVNTTRFKPSSEEYKHQLRESFGYKPDDFLMFYAAEFNKNKNQQFLIQSLALLKDELPQAKLLLAGEGALKEHCKELAIKLGVLDMVDFLGYRNDIDQILPMCDIAVASSLREGLPVNIMEAMACGLPVIATNNRGHRELVRDYENGWIILPGNINEMAEKIKILAQNHNLRIELGVSGRNMIERRYAIHHVLNEQTRIYKDFMRGTEELLWAVQ